MTYLLIVALILIAIGAFDCINHDWPGRTFLLGVCSFITGACIAFAVAYIHQTTR